jgi:hypothetical protein
MATTHNSFAISEIADRIKYVEDVLAAMKTGKNIEGKDLKDYTIRTQTYIRSCERRDLMLIADLLANCPDGVMSKLSVASRETFARLTKSPSEGKTLLPEGCLKEGDDFLKFLVSNPSASVDKIDRYLAVHGLKRDGSKIVKV